MSEALKVLKDEELPWYSDGLAFQCTGCGQCCTGGPGYIWVNEEEIQEIAAHLKLSVEDFSAKYLRKVGNRYSLRELSNYDCVFLKDKACSIYSVRPTQCRTYPWWPQIMTSEHAWEREAAYCEGICKNAGRVPRETIETNLKVHRENSPM